MLSKLHCFLMWCCLLTFNDSVPALEHTSPADTEGLLS